MNVTPFMENEKMAWECIFHWSTGSKNTFVTKIPSEKQFWEEILVGLLMNLILYCWWPLTNSVEKVKQSAETNICSQAIGAHKRLKSRISNTIKLTFSKGLSTYYVIPDGGGGLPDLLQYYIGGGGSPQFITILHRGGLESLLQYYSFERKVEGYNPFSALN